MDQYLDRKVELVEEHERLVALCDAAEKRIQVFNDDAEYERNRETARWRKACEEEIVAMGGRMQHLNKRQHRDEESIPQIIDRLCGKIKQLETNCSFLQTQIDLLNSCAADQMEARPKLRPPNPIPVFLSEADS
jgi:hypothetical protein